MEPVTEENAVHQCQCKIGIPNLNCFYLKGSEWADYIARMIKEKKREQLEAI